MAMMAYMHVKGQKQGDIKGSVTQKGREGSIAVIAYHHSVVSPRDPQSGLRGDLKHRPVVFREAIRREEASLQPSGRPRAECERRFLLLAGFQRKRAGAGRRAREMNHKLRRARLDAVVARRYIDLPRLGIRAPQPDLAQTAVL